MAAGEHLFGRRGAFLWTQRSICAAEGEHFIVAALFKVAQVSFFELENSRLFAKFLVPIGRIIFLGL